MAVPLTLSRMGLFQGCWRIGGAKRLHLTLKSVIFFPTIMKLGTITPYLKNFKKCINHATDSLSFADIRSAFFHRKSATSFISRNTDIIYILIHNLQFFSVFKDCFNRCGCNFPDVRKIGYFSPSGNKDILK